PAGHDGRERDDGSHARKLCPLLPEITPTLGIDRDGSCDGEYEQRAKEDEGCKVAIHDEVDQGPQCDSTQERVARNAKHPTRYGGSLRETRFHTHSRWARGRNPDHHEEKTDEHQYVRRWPEPEQQPPERYR